MERTPTDAAWRGPFTSTPINQQASCHCEKANKIEAFYASEGPVAPAIDAVAAEFSARDVPRTLRSTK
jgi:hypothetical protein